MYLAATMSDGGFYFDPLYGTTDGQTTDQTAVNAATLPAPPKNDTIPILILVLAFFIVLRD